MKGTGHAGPSDEQHSIDLDQAAVLYLLYNPGRHRASLAQSIETLRGAGLRNIVLLDNGSDEADVAAWATSLDGVEVWRSDTNLLFAQGCNQLARLTDAAKLVFLNQDTVVDAGVVGALEVVTEGACLTFAQEFPWSTGPMVPELTRNGAFLWSSSNPERRTTNVLSGGAFAIHRDTIDKRLGGSLFDPRIPHYGEDIHLSLRLERADVEILAWTASPVLHDSSPSTGSRPRDFQRAIKIQRNTLRAFFFELGPSQFVRRIPRLLVGAWEKADVDGRATLPRRLGLVAATLVALVGFWRPATQLQPGLITRCTAP